MFLVLGYRGDDGCCRHGNDVCCALIGPLTGRHVGLSGRGLVRCVKYEWMNGWIDGVNAKVVPNGIRE